MTIYASRLNVYTVFGCSLILFSCGKLQLFSAFKSSSGGEAQSIQAPQPGTYDTEPRKKSTDQQSVKAEPSMSEISDQATDEDEPLKNIKLTVSDPGRSLLACGWIQKSSSNQTLLKNSGIILRGAMPNCIVDFYPESNQNGETIVTLSFYSGDNKVTRNFKFLVKPVNDGPDLKGLMDMTAEPSSTIVQNFFLSDSDHSNLSCTESVKSMTSSEPEILPLANLSIQGDAPRCRLVVTRTSSEPNGKSDISIEVSDGLSSVTKTIAYTAIVPHQFNERSIGIGQKRRAFYDPVSARHWAFVHSTIKNDAGEQMEKLRIENSEDGQNWVLRGAIDVDSKQFITEVNPGSVYLVVASQNRVTVRKGKLFENGVEFDAPQTVFNDPDYFDDDEIRFWAPAAAIDEGGYLWVAVVESNRSGYLVRVRRSFDPAEAGLSAFSVPTTVVNTSRVEALSIFAAKEKGLHLFAQVGDFLEGYFLDLRPGASREWSLLGKSGGKSFRSL